MSIFGDNEGFSLTGGGDDGVKKKTPPSPPRRTPPANNQQNGVPRPPATPARRTPRPAPPQNSGSRANNASPVRNEPEKQAPKSPPRPTMPQMPRVNRQREDAYQSYQSPERHTYDETTQHEDTAVYDREDYQDTAVYDRENYQESSSDGYEYHNTEKDDTYRSQPTAQNNDYSNYEVRNNQDSESDVGYPQHQPSPYVQHSDNSTRYADKSISPATYTDFPDDSYKEIIPDENSAFGDTGARPLRIEPDEDRMERALARQKEREAQLLKPKVEFSYDDDEEDETPKKPRSSKGRTNRSNAKNKPLKKSKKAKVEGDKTPHRFSGSRKKVLIVNCVAGAVILSILGLGLKPILFPEHIPTPGDVDSRIETTLNITAFNKEGAKPMVSSFAREYFANSEEADKQKIMESYTTEGIASEIVTSISSEAGTKQGITGEPQILNIVAHDDSNATYTVGVKLGSKWVYIDVPVFFNKESKSYAISGIPAFTPPATVAVIGSEVDEGQNDVEIDVEVGDETSENVKSFLQAWAKSDTEALSRYITTTASQNAKLGLQNTAYFDSVEQYEVFYLPEGSPDEENNRTARVSVLWKNAPQNATIKYKQNFELKLYKQPDGKWYFADISPVETKYSSEITEKSTEDTPSEEPVE